MKYNNLIRPMYNKVNKIIRNDRHSRLYDVLKHLTFSAMMSVIVIIIMESLKWLK